ncbi:uncharacterized protein LOC126661585 [Mercurialis annua]|uniref:uncharacterized protein LOC126661585 n=1 Tax=Mercurialis annua TaxID=3986 RepID=UPI0024AF6481|nr:uncharacterized protein LOC126661585 [Mercurialis annua]
MTGRKRTPKEESTARANQDDNEEALLDAPIENNFILNGKLSLYPRGNKKRNGDEYISLYLLLSESNRLTFNQEINVNFKLSVYDYIHDKYLIAQDADEEVRRFHGIKREWGFDKLVSVTDFKDNFSGYLMDDCCIFGAEIFVVENAHKDLSTIFQLKFRSLDVHPKGDSRAKGKTLSIFLRLDDDENGRKLYAEYMLRVRNQFEGKHRELGGKEEFIGKGGWGYSNFMSLDDLNDKSKGFIHSNTLIVEAEIQAMTVIKELS